MPDAATGSPDACTTTAPPPYVVSVRELCAFAAKVGDLDLRFTPSPTAVEGIAGHQAVTRRRGSNRRAEVQLLLDYRTLRVRGRADGFDEADAHLDEVKTHRGLVERIPENHRALHLAQAKVYGWMLCQQLELPRLRVSVIYFNIDTEVDTPVSESFDAASLRVHFESLADRFLAWAERELGHRVSRDASLRFMTWPHPEYRSGQRQLAKAVYNSVRSRRHLLAQAPTGIGKTLATLFPMLKAMPGRADCGPLDKVFFLTAKTTGRQLALDALETLRGTNGETAPLRVVELLARDKACVHPDKQCHGDSCPLARGFFDRLPAARSEAVKALTQPPPSIREVALRHQVCPYYLVQELTRWADVVVADYNYFFDASALLNALTVENEWKVGVLVDEAHNLVSRARAMYSAELSLAALRTATKKAPPPLQKSLKRLQRAAKVVVKSQTEDYSVYDEVPALLVDTLRALASDVSGVLAEAPAALDAETLEVYFDALRFLALEESFDRSSQFDVSVERRALAKSNDATLCIRNIVPASFLARRFDATRATVLFSATLVPFDYQRAMLGLAETTVDLDVPSPFSAEQLKVHLTPDISTRFSDRAASLPRVARLIVDQYETQPGNYLAFFSSFDYLFQVAAQVECLAPGLALRLQQRNMREAERKEFVDSFTVQGSQLGFAVLGGAFGEGLDLPGSRLFGAFIATLGLPQLNPVNESMRRRMQELFGEGYAYAYLYPGLQKVVQAAGRVIRTPHDNGVLHLIDDRFARHDVRELLPPWWRVESAKPLSLDLRSPRRSAGQSKTLLSNGPLQPSLLP